MLTEYDRYFEAEKILEEIQNTGVNFHDIVVLDYGAGAGDYGFAFGRQGSGVLFCDTEDFVLDFLRFRWARDGEKFRAAFLSPDSLKTQSTTPFQVAIFGEVLEHVEDPRGILEYAHARGARYIFTSSYPFRRQEATDDYWKESGHKEEARLAQPACREFLETNYKKMANFGGQLNLWRRRG